MRNSPFQLKSSSLFQTMEQNNHYQRHRKTLEAMRSRGTSPKDFMKNLKGVNNSLQRTRKFQSMERSR